MIPTLTTLTNGPRTLEVFGVDLERQTMSVEEWPDADHGEVFQMKISDANAQGFVVKGGA